MYPYNSEDLQNIRAWSLNASATLYSTNEILTEGDTAPSATMASSIIYK